MQWFTSKKKCGTCSNPANVTIKDGLISVAIQSFAEIVRINHIAPSPLTRLLWLILEPVFDFTEKC
jgi:hypothetical protein